MRIVWMCHFSNKEVRELLPLSNRRLLSALKIIFGKLGGNTVQQPYHDFAPWVTNLIKEFEKFNGVELHIISPMAGLKKYTVEFELKGIYYHFFKPDLPLIHINLLKDHLKKPNFSLNRYFIKKIIRTVKPDIINLIGAENPYYSIAALDVKDTPLYVSCQTIYSNPDRRKHGDSINSWRWEVEQKIHKKEKYFGCGGRMHRDLLLKNNSHAIVFKNTFPIEKPKEVELQNKIYDFVFFAGIAKKKGIEDLIKAMAFVKKEYNNVTLNIIGKCGPSYFSLLKTMIKELDLGLNIIFDDYFPKHEDMHQHVVKSRFAVLPVKLDIISSSVREAILLDLPVVTYKTSGTPYLNKDGEAVLIAEMNNINELANLMIRLLRSPELAERLKRNAKSIVEKEFDNTVNAKQLVSNYKAIINHYNQNIPIPDELLFNLEEFPVY